MLKTQKFIDLSKDWTFSYNVSIVLEDSCFRKIGYSQAENPRSLKKVKYKLISNIYFKDFFEDDTLEN